MGGAGGEREKEYWDRKELWKKKRGRTEELLTHRQGEGKCVRKFFNKNGKQCVTKGSTEQYSRIV